MARRVEGTPAAALEQHFQHNIAVVIGINRYEYVRRLNTARPDAEYLASLLCDDKQRRDELDRYKLFERYDEEATFEAIHRLLTDILPTEVKKAGPQTRLIFYFAGHGDAEYTDNTIKGYLFPQDAQPREQDEAQRKLLPMAEVQKRLAELDCRHVLIILDCCSAGAMAKESATRSALLPPPLYWDTLQRYVGRKARQVITSAAHNQKASDVAPGYNVGERDPDDNAAHSPFALALFEALAADPLQGRDLRGAGRDGVVTATELYLSISDSLYRQVGEAQTPGLWLLSDQGHDQGDFVFLLPGARVKKLESAPDLTRVEYDPWPPTGDQGLAQAELFAGRDEEARELARRVDAKPLVAVTGSSAVGKTTLVQAGLLPWLRAGNGVRTDGASMAWHVLPPIRLAAPAPLQTLIAHVSQALGGEMPGEAGQGMGDLRALAAAWAEAHPGQRLLLAVDAPEAMFKDAGEAERAQLWAALTEAAQQNILHIIVTLRSDHWYVRSETAGDDKRTLLPAAERFELGRMNLVALHQVIDRPATARMIEFESDALVDRLAKSVDGQPAALPLLTETLHRMYLRYANAVKHEDRCNDRTLTQADYDAVGGVDGVVADLAGSIYKDQPDESSMQHVLMRLVKVEAGQYTGGNANRKDFNFPDAEAAGRAGDIIDALAACGLVVQGADAAGEPYVALGHRVLLEAWQPLREWLVEKGAEWTLQRELTARVEEWQPNQPKTLLWDDDARLPQVEETLWPADKPGEGLGDRLRWEWRVLFPPKNAAPDATAWVNRAELEFVRASVNERSGFRQKLFGAIAAFVIVVAILGGLAWWQREIAIDNEVTAVAAVTAEATARMFAEQKRVEAVAAVTAEATARIFADQKRVEAEAAATKEATARAVAEGERVKAQTAEANAQRSAQAEATAAADARLQARRSRAGELAALSQTAFQESPQRSLLLAREAYSLTLGTPAFYAPTVEQVLRDNLRMFGGRPLSYAPTQLQGALSVAISPNGKWLAAGGFPWIRLWQVDLPQARAVFTQTTPFFGELLAFSRNGSRLVAAGTGQNLIYVWSLDDPNMPLTVLGRNGSHGMSLKAIDVSVNGRWIASAGGTDSTVGIWDAEHPEQPPRVLRQEGDVFGFTDVALNPADDKKLAASTGNVVFTWNLAELNPKAILANTHDADVSAIAYSPDGKWLASAGQDGILLLTGTTAGGGRQRWYFPTPLTSLAFSRDGNWLAVGGDDSVVRVLATFGSGDSSEVTTLQGHQGSITALSFNEDGHFLVSASSDKTARVWDLSIPQAIPAVLVGHDSALRAVAISTESGRIATAAADRNVRLWDTKQPSTEPLSLRGHTIFVTHGVFSPPCDGEDNSVKCHRWLATASSASDPAYPINEILIWDLDSVPPEPKLLANNLRHVVALAFSSDRRWLAASVADRMVHLWSLGDTISKTLTLEVTERAADKLMFTPDSRHLIAANVEALRIYDLDEPQSEPLRVTTPPKPIGQDFINAIALDREGRWLALASTDKTIRLLTLDHPVLDTAIKLAPGGEVNRLAFDPQGRWLVAASGKKVLVWDIRHLSVDPVYTLPHDGNVHGLAFALTGRRLATVSGNIAYLWNTDDLGLPPVLLRGQDAWIETLAFSPDGDWLATSGGLLWHLPGSEPSAIKFAHDNAKHLLIAISPDGHQLLSSGADGSLRLWTVPSESLALEICAVVGRNLTHAEWQQYFPNKPYRPTCTEWPSS
jgi:WD40 repeat protein